MPSRRPRQSRVPPRQSRVPPLGEEALLRQQFYFAQLQNNDADLVHLYRRECLGRLYRLRRNGVIVQNKVRLNDGDFLKFVRNHLQHTSLLLAESRHIRVTPPPTFTLSRHTLSFGPTRSDQEILVIARRRKGYLEKASSDALLRQTLHRFLNHSLNVQGDQQDILRAQDQYSIQTNVPLGLSSHVPNYVNTYGAMP